LVAHLQLTTHRTLIKCLKTKERLESRKTIQFYSIREHCVFKVNEIAVSEANQSIKEDRGGLHLLQFADLKAQ
jgi:hypothetical protein